MTQWTQERTDEVLALWSAGKSARAIAARIGGAMTRNAVISKLNRMGANKRVARQATQRRKPAVAPPPAVAPVPVAARVEPPYVPPVPVFETPVAERRAMLDLDAHHCRWPYGDSPYTFCGRGVVPGQSYCRPHVAMAHKPQDEIKPRQRPAEPGATGVAARSETPAGDAKFPRQSASQARGER